MKIVTECGWGARVMKGERKNLGGRAIHATFMPGAESLMRAPRPYRAAPVRPVIQFRHAIVAESTILS